MTQQYGEVKCLSCHQIVPVVKMNGEWRRLYHHNRTGHACTGSRMPVIDSTVKIKAQKNEQLSSGGNQI